jgi:hypothetical protein
MNDWLMAYFLLSGFLFGGLGLFSQSNFFKGLFVGLLGALFGWLLLPICIIIGACMIIKEFFE